MASCLQFPRIVNDSASLCWITSYRRKLSLPLVQFPHCSLDTFFLDYFTFQPLLRVESHPWIFTRHFPEFGLFNECLQTTNLSLQFRNLYQEGTLRQMLRLYVQIYESKHLEYASAEQQLK